MQVKVRKIKMDCDYESELEGKEGCGGKSCVGESGIMVE